MKIQLKRSSVLDGGEAKKPTANQMEYGELAVNYSNADPAIFLKDTNNNIVRIAGAGANGNIEIPDSGSSPHQPGTLDDRYVEVTGDNMTGDLTLGTDKIKLDATTGLVEAGGGFKVAGGTSAGVENGYLFSSGFLREVVGSKSITFNNGSSYSMSLDGSGGVNNNISFTKDYLVVNITSDISGTGGALRVRGTYNNSANTDHSSLWFQGIDYTGIADNASVFGLRLDSPINTAATTAAKNYGVYVNNDYTDAFSENYGIYSFLSGGSNTNYNFYAAGSAPNYFEGKGIFNSGVEFVSPGGTAATVNNGLFSQFNNTLSIAINGKEQAIFRNGDNIFYDTDAGSAIFNISPQRMALTVNQTTTKSAAFVIRTEVNRPADKKLYAMTINNPTYNAVGDDSKIFGTFVSGPVNNTTATNTTFYGYGCTEIADKFDTNIGFYSNVLEGAKTNFNFLAQSNAPNFFSGDIYIGGTYFRNTLELWKSTLTEEQIEQLEAGTLVIPANVSIPGDGEFARQWWYDQQDQETQTAIDAGEFDYPAYLAPATFTDTFELTQTTSTVLQKSGAAYFTRALSGGGAYDSPNWSISPSGQATGITVTRASVVTDEQAGTVETLIDIITDLRARVAALEAAS